MEKKISKKILRLKGGKDMSTATLHIVEKENKKITNSNWPNHISKPSDDDLQFLAELSKRDTGSNFFDKKKR